MDNFEVNKEILEEMDKKKRPIMFYIGMLIGFILGGLIGSVIQISKYLEIQCLICERELVNCKEKVKGNE